MIKKLMDSEYWAAWLAGITVTACLIIVLVALVLGTLKQAPGTGPGADPAPAAGSDESLSHEGYTLEQVVVLSRHNIRAPLVGGDSVLGQITPHEWTDWSAPASQLTVRGGTLETGMGQYFRKWLEDEGFFPENYRPDEDAVRIYANSKQRTIATAQFFTAGLLPAAGEDVEYHAEFDTMDPVFEPKLTFYSDSYSDAARKQIYDMYGEDMKDLADNYEFLANTIDMADSKAVEDGSIEGFSTGDTRITLEEGKEPSMEGSLKTGCSVSDALVLQYYEEEDAKKAAFGNDLDEDEWKEIVEIKDLYTDVLFGAPLVADNVANPLLKELQKEMDADGREFSFLCGHDSNLVTVLTALDTEKYELPGAVERATPIGSKLVLTKWKAADGKEYWDADLVYQTAGQLRNRDILDEEDHPGITDLQFKGLSQNADSLYTDRDLKQRFTDAIAGYDRLKETY